MQAFSDKWFLVVILEASKMADVFVFFFQHFLKAGESECVFPSSSSVPE